MLEWPMTGLDSLTPEQVLELIACIIVIGIIFILYYCMAPCREDNSSENESNAFFEEADSTDTKLEMLNNNEFFKLEDEEQPNKCHLYKSNISCNRNMIV